MMSLESSSLVKQIDYYFDQLLLARFNEQFGDIITNSKGFDLIPFGNYVHQMNIGPFGSDLKNEFFVSKSEGYCMVYEQKHAIDRDFTVECRYVTKEKYTHLKRFEVGPGDILVSCRGTIGKCVLLPEDAEIGIIHPSVMMIKPKKDVNPHFLLILLEKLLKVQIQRGSGVKMAIKANKLSKIMTICPPKPLQDDYISFVNQVNLSKSLYLQQIHNYDLLISAKFIEEFGILRINSKKLTMSTLGKLGKFKTGGTPSSDKPEYYEGNIPFISTPALGPNYIDESASKYKITEAAIFDSATCIIPAGSLIIGTRINVGKSSINVVELCTNQDIASMVEINKDYDVLFLKHCVDQYIPYLDSKKKGATIKGISLKLLKSINIPIVPLVQQKEYAEFVTQIDKSKLLLVESMKSTLGALLP